MKRNLFMLGAGILLAGASLISACTKEGPTGPQGPAGTNGTNGTNGKDGENGKDAVITCGLCHSSSDLLTAVMKQYAHSLHYEGEAFTEGSRAGCAECHSSQGFRESVTKGILAASVYTNPAPVNCRTCHKIHETYTEADTELRTIADVRNRQDSANASMNFKFGEGNLCANCHQARRISPAPDIATAGATYKITSSRFGPHHGPQANLVNGYQKSGAFELGTGYVSTSAHINGTNCVKCHLAPTAADFAGGHTFLLSFTTATDPVKPTSYTYSTATCTPCHTTADALTILKATQTDVVAQLATLKSKLIAAGILNATTDLAIPGTFDAKQVAAFINYKYVEEDKSYGVHNPKYIKTLLANSIAVLP